MIEPLLEAERLLKAGSKAEAERLYGQVAEADPRNAIARAGWARVALERGDGATAAERARAALAIDPANPVARRVLAAATDPATTNPARTSRAASDPGMIDPGTTDPGTTDPGTTHSAAIDRERLRRLIGRLLGRR